MAAHAFGKDRVLAVQLHADLEALVRLAVLADAHICRWPRPDAALVVVEHLGRRKAREDLDAGPSACWANHLVASDRLMTAAVVVEVARHEGVRRAGGLRLGQEEHVVTGDRLFERRAFLPVREQLGDGARSITAPERMWAPGSEPFQHDDACVGLQLLEPDGGGEPGRAGADDDHVVLHRFARAVLGQDVFGVMDGGSGCRCTGLDSTNRTTVLFRAGFQSRAAALLNPAGCQALRAIVNRPSKVVRCIGARPRARRQRP